MSFVSGTGIGPYVIEREIGRGGMGIVYLARDPRLDRNVAIKVLPEHLATDPARLERFEIEARSLAQLNHPNVAGILGLEEKEGQKFLILEYVEGEALSERLGRGSITVEEALDICVQIAAGVESAHEAGVIHRDLKPDNIRITPDGDVKVLDFGLAKMTEEPTTAASDEAIHDAPTLTTPYQHSPTIPGVIMGTAAYMSPEQARGRRIDKRTDIWSFGVVLYECLSGAGPFAGETANDSIGAILHKDVDFERLPASTPGLVKHVLSGCLERDKSQRYRDIGDVRLELVRAGSEAGVPADESRPGPARSTVIGLVLAASILAAAATWFGKPATPTPPLPVVHVEAPLPEGSRMAHYFCPGLAISPDGQTVAFFYGDDPVEGETMMNEIGPRGIMLRHLDQPAAVPVAGPDIVGSELVFSPDGKWIAYAGKDGLYKVPVSGGQPTKISTTLKTCGLAWGEDGSIVAGLFDGGLVRIPSTGGAVDTLTTIDSDPDVRSHRLPHFLPGSGDVLFTRVRDGTSPKAADKYSACVWRRSTGKSALLIEHASDVRFVNGHLVFVREGSLFAVPFDPEKIAATGAPRQVLDGVQQSIYATTTGAETGAGQYALSTTGTLVYVPGSVMPAKKVQAVRVDREGTESLIDIEPRQYYAARGSPDGKRLLLTDYYPPTSSVWIHDFEREVSRRQVVDGVGVHAAWGPGPERITLFRMLDEGRERLFTRPVGGSGADEVEIEIPTGTKFRLGTWSNDGKYLLAVNQTNMDLLFYCAEDGWTPILETVGIYEGWPSFSPDGRWLAYTSTESGDPEILVRPFPDPGPTVQVSLGGGFSPIWSRDGSELFFRGTDDGGWIMAAAVSEVAGRLEFGRPRVLFKDDYMQGIPIHSWGVLADGDFVFRRPLTTGQMRERLIGLHANRFRVVQNWASTLAEDD